MSYRKRPRDVSRPTPRHRVTRPAIRRVRTACALQDRIERDNQYRLWLDEMRNIWHAQEIAEFERQWREGRGFADPRFDSGSTSGRFA